MKTGRTPFVEGVRPGIKFMGTEFRGMVNLSPPCIEFIETDVATLGMEPLVESRVLHDDVLPPWSNKCNGYILFVGE